MLGTSDAVDIVGRAFVVVVADPVTDAVDVFGPYDRSTGDAEVARRRAELDAEQLHDVIVRLITLNPPAARRPGSD